MAKPGSRFAVDIDDNEKNDQFKINDVPKSTIPPLDLDQDSHCDEFLYAHAPSEVTYAIPQGAISFSAIGYCLQSGDVDFQVRVDNRPDPIFRTGKTALAPVIVDLPEGAMKPRRCRRPAERQERSCFLALPEVSPQSEASARKKARDARKSK